MKKTLLKNETIKPPKVGDIVEGKVIGWTRACVFLDLGPIGTGIIYGREFYEAKDKLKNLEVGSKVAAKIVDLENEEGYIELSLREASNEIAWKNLEEKKEKEEKITVRILGANKGGLLTQVLGIPAFLPVSQLSPKHYPRVEGGDTSIILKELQKFIGKDLEVRILSLSPKEKKLILSEKAEESEKIKEILKNYKIGEVVEGKISGITDFGVFIKFPAREDKKFELEGLIHISELDWGIVEDPSKIVKLGEKIKAKIIDISGNKIFLSLKALKKDPWENIEKKYKKGDIVKGKVVKLNPFGAFVKITPEIQGLCHISEFDNQESMEEKLRIGKEYSFQILSIAPKEHRMTLKPIND